MFGTLTAAVDELGIPPWGDALVEVIAVRDRLDAAITEAVGAFDASGGWEFEGATSMTAWLRHRAGQSGRDAARLSRTARILRSLPTTAAAFRAGELSGGQVGAIVANVSDATLGIFADHEAALLPVLTPLGVPELSRAMQAWRQRAEATLDDGDAPEEPKRELHHSETLDGRWVTDASFDPEGGALVDAALGLATSPDVEGDPVRSPSRRRADALVDVCRWFLGHWGKGETGRRPRPDVNVVVDLADLPEGIGSLIGGAPLDSTTVKRLLCDASVHRVITDGPSTILDYGRTTRTVPASLWAAVVLRDRHCRHPGCDRGPQWCEAHHSTPWAEGGLTDLGSLALACSRHHHLWHRPGWHMKLLPDGDVHVTTPDGRVLVSRPPPLTGANGRFTGSNGGCPNRRRSSPY